MKIEFGGEATESLTNMMDQMIGWTMLVTYRAPDRVFEDFMYRGHDYDGRGDLLSFEFERVDEEHQPTGQVVSIDEADIEDIYVY